MKEKKLLNNKFCYNNKNKNASNSRDSHLNAAVVKSKYTMNEIIFLFISKVLESTISDCDVYWPHKLISLNYWPVNTCVYLLIPYLPARTLKQVRLIHIAKDKVV